MLASTALLWIAVAAGFVPLLHHAGGDGGASCDDGPIALAAVALHAEDCEHHDAHDSDDPGTHCPVCRGLQQATAALPDRAPSVVPIELDARSVRVPTARSSGGDYRLVAAARGPPPAA